MTQLKSYNYYVDQNMGLIIMNAINCVPAFFFYGLAILCLAAGKFELPSGDVCIYFVAGLIQVVWQSAIFASTLMYLWQVKDRNTLLNELAEAQSCMDEYM